MSDREQISTSTRGKRVAADELRQLKAVIRDLGACLSLPALWASGGPEFIAQGVLDVLISMLRVDVAYIRLDDPDGGEPFEAARPQSDLSPRQIGKLLNTWVDPLPPASPPACVPNFLDRGTLNIAYSRLGLHDEGVVAVAACRTDFPNEIDSFLLGAIVTQAVVSLRSAKNVAQLASAASENARLYQQSLQIQRALEESEERYRRLLALLPVAVYTCAAPSGVITFYNEHAASLWGRSPKLGDTDERFCGSFKLWRPGGTPLTHDETPMAVAIREGREFRNQPVVIERPDGTRITVLVNIDPIRNEEGGVTGAVNVFHDVTALKQAEEALRQADKRKDEFMAMLGHELRNPLGIIGNAAQLLRRVEGSDPRLQELCEMIDRQVLHSSRMLDDLLDVSRISLVKVQLNRQVWDLRDIVIQTIQDYRRSFRDSNLRLEVSLAEQPLRVLGDRTRLAQVLGNLLHNGWKFTEQGGTIAVKLEGMGGEAVLSVRDTGIGMTPDVLHHIFEPFSQGHTSLDRSQGGLGLGLALVKGMVELHSGAIDARSEGAGCGSEFIVRLPLATAQAVSGSSAPDQTKLSCHYRILIIEDNRLAARSSQMILEQSGHTVEVTHSGPHGIQAARRFRPEVVLCDIGLPGLDGYTVARVLRQDEGLHGSFLIAVSGYAEDERRLREAGFNAHLTKPIDFADLERLLATLAAENSTLATPVETRAKSTTQPL